MFLMCCCWAWAAVQQGLKKEDKITFLDKMWENSIGWYGHEVEIAGGNIGEIIMEAYN